jgi:hypothetical protein
VFFVLQILYWKIATVYIVQARVAYPFCIIANYCRGGAISVAVVSDGVLDGNGRDFRCESSLRLLLL